LDMNSIGEFLSKFYSVWIFAPTWHCTYLLWG
jgi:hypothetical protein